jgi:dihydromethanopterin reductase (acceptor)
VYGIADTLPTAAFAEAGKSGVPVIVYPSDMPGRDGYAVSEAPCMINRDKCDCMGKLGYCPASKACPVDAIPIVSGKPRIDLSLCIGCGKCMDACINNAITCWAPVKVKPRRIDIENIEKLTDFSNVIVASSLSEVREAMLDILLAKKSKDRRA